MMYRAWSSIGEAPYCFSRSYVKFQGHTALKIVEFDPNLAFPDSNSSLNSPMAMKCCTKLETAKERCPIVVGQGHPSNFKVTRDKISPILTQIGRFRTIGRSQLSNPSDLPWYGSNQIKLVQYDKFISGVVRSLFWLLTPSWICDVTSRHTTSWHVTVDEIARDMKSQNPKSQDLSDVTNPRWRLSFNDYQKAAPNLLLRPVLLLSNLDLMVWLTGH